MPYSSQALAEKAGAVFIMKTLLGKPTDHPRLDGPYQPECDVPPHYVKRWDRDLFEAAFQQENYSECVRIWNRYVHDYRYDHMRGYVIKIGWTAADAPYTI